MEQVVLEVSSLEETKRIAKLFAENLQDNSLGLSGKLGAGKTEFVRSLASALGIKETITSPTYVFEQEYELSKTKGKFSRLQHWDLYRASQDDFVQEIKESLKDPGCLVLVEWPEKVLAVQDLLSLRILIDSHALSGAKNEENPAYFDDGRRIFRIFCNPESRLFGALKAV